MATHDDAPRPEKPRRAVVTDGSVAVEVVPLDALTPLADNPRTHTSRGIDVITASLSRVGAARSGVIDEARTILVGNGLHEAAAQAGYREALVVTTDGTRPVFVRRTGLSPTQKARLIVDDNRASERSRWNPTLAEYAERDPSITDDWTRPAWRAAVGPARSLTAVPVTLDDGPPADLGDRQELFRVLRALDVDVRGLILALWKWPDRVLLIKERRARLYEVQATAGRPVTKTLLRAYTQYSARLARHDCQIPDDVADAVHALVNALETPVNALTDRMDGPSTPEERAHDRTAERYAAARRRLSLAHHRIATGAATTAIQQRYMRAVRRTVHRRILTALEAYEGPPLVYGGRQIVSIAVRDVAAAPNADILTAAFVRLVYTLWGATTTVESVRKARARR